MKRQEFLRLSGLGLLSLCIDPLTLLQALAAPPDSADSTGKVLVLIELQGGNDGLNTLVPYADQTYYQLRPQIGISRDQVLPLSPELGLHPALAALLPLWKQRQLAWVLGVGYPEPNRSHFRSIEIWESGSDANEYLANGWLTQVLSRLPAAQHSLADGVLLGQAASGPLAGDKLKTLALNNGGRLPQAQSNPLTSTQGPEALQHILRVEASLNQASQELNRRLNTAQPLPFNMPNTPLGRQLGQVATLIRAGFPVPVYKLTHGGFDTHRQQLGTHARLLRELAEALSAFHQNLSPNGHWQRTLVMSYSEFGRRAAENGSKGTDHGTAAPQLILGGQVKGGLFGRQPDLTQLSNADLRHSVDFRSLYQTLAGRWWGLQTPWPVSRFPLLNFV